MTATITFLKKIKQWRSWTATHLFKKKKKELDLLVCKFKSTNVKIYQQLVCSAWELQKWGETTVIDANNV